MGQRRQGSEDTDLLAATFLLINCGKIESDFVVNII
jgi:hypothetical protein